MIDVAAKATTHRLAIAVGEIYVGPEAFPLIASRSLPKGDALVLAEVAGIQGAKNASQMIPLCHPLGLDHVEVRTELDAERQTVTVYCSAATHARTGVEMEALAGANAALLTIWDLTKMIDAKLAIGGVRLLAKVGGKSGLWLHPDGVPGWVKDKVSPPPEPAAAPVLNQAPTATITLSDRASQGDYEDKSGALLSELLLAAGADVKQRLLLPDEQAPLVERIRQLHADGIRLIICTGGTGVAPRDITPEAVTAACDRLVPGIGELLRQFSAQFTRNSWASRSIAGTLGDTLVIALPGSPKAVRECLQCLLPLLPHLLNTLHDIKHD